MRVGVVGAGSIGTRHICNLLSLGCEVVAMDVSAEARAMTAAAHPRAKVADSLPFTGLEAIVIATPAAQHLSWVEEAVTRGLPFFVEKPLGTLGQLQRWRDLAARPLPTNQVGYMLRFHSDVAWLRESIACPTAIDLSVWWDGSKYRDGLLESSHELDLAFFLSGRDLALVGVERFSDGEIAVTFDGYVWVQINSASETYRRAWGLEGGAHRQASANFDEASSLGVQMYRDEMAHFLHCVRGQVPTICPLADGLRVLELCAQIEATA